MAQTHGHSVDEYLETIYFLAFPIGEYRPATGSTAIASRVAEMLGVSRASAGEMLKRLEAEGLVERGEQKEAILTPEGAERARRVVRKHRIIERFLTDFMGYTAAESHVHADELGDTFTDEMIERINDRLGGPDRCPHGWPVDTEFEQAENAELVALAELEVGRDGRIVRLAEHDGDLLHWFYDEGLVPGSQVAVVSAQPAAGQLTIARRGRRARDQRARGGRHLRPRRVGPYESLTVSTHGGATMRPASRGEERRAGGMTLNRHTVGALAATAAVLVGGRRGARRVPGPTATEARAARHALRRIAEQRGVTVEQLTADVKARLLARIDAAEKAGRVSPERADEAARARRRGQPLRRSCTT